MQTHEGALRGAPVAMGQATSGTGGMRQMRQAAVTALWALAGGAVLIGMGAVMSICWTVHPLLAVVAAVGLVWVGSRLAGLAFRSPTRS